MVKTTSEVFIRNLERDRPSPIEVGTLATRSKTTPDPGDEAAPVDGPSTDHGSDLFGRLEGGRGQ